MPIHEHIFSRHRAHALFACAAVVVFLLLSGCFAPRALAGDMELNGLVLDNEAGNISVRFGVRLLNLAALAAELDAGGSVELNCRASVHRRKTLWPDKHLAGAEWTSVLSKDLLADEYVLTLPGEDAPRRGKLLPILLRDAWGGLTMDLGPWKSLEQGHDYRLALSISLDRTDVPVWLRYVVFFWSFDVAPPIGYQLEFTY